MYIKNPESLTWKMALHNSNALQHGLFKIQSLCSSIDDTFQHILQLMDESLPDLLLACHAVKVGKF